VAGYDLIAAVLPGPDDSGLGNALVLDAEHHRPHFFIIPNLERVVFESVELVQFDIDDLFLSTAGRFFGRLLRLRLFRGRRLHSGRTLVSLLFRSGSLRGLFLAPGGLGRRFLPDGSFLLVRRLFCRSGLFLVRRSFRLCLLRRAAPALRRLRCFVRLLFHSLVRLFGLLCLIRWCGCLLRRFFFFRRFLLGHDL